MYIGAYISNRVVYLAYLISKNARPQLVHRTRLGQADDQMECDVLKYIDWKVSQGQHGPVLQVICDCRVRSHHVSGDVSVA